MDNSIVQSILLLSGITVSTFAAAGVFFFKFYRTSRDSFYLLFALACFLFSLERIAILVIIGPAQTSENSTPWVYVLRLFAFLLIVWAIYNKNRQRKF